MHRSTIAVFPAEAWAEHQPLLQALTELYPVDFLAGQGPDLAHLDAALLFGVSRAQALRAGESGRPCLAFITEPGAGTCAVSGNVCFSTLPSLPPGLRGSSLPHSPLQVTTLTEQPGDTVVARSSGRILWTQRLAGSSHVHLLAMEPPALPPDGYLFQIFKPTDWARLFPVLRFLRDVSDLKLPPLRACFMFDDPNLHWKSYGHVNYPRLLQHARTHNYHVSFATVPLDGWFTHKPTAALFRDNPDRLSLLVHGNNHTHRELAQVLSEEERLALGAQALLRTACLERASGLSIPRVMAAPHGACSKAMAAVLLRLGFEAACISRGSIMAHNRDHAWRKAVGLQPAEFLENGLPIIPRFGLAPTCHTELLLASSLGLPIILVGHHHEVAGGLDLLQQLADFINSFGGVRWTDLGSIARSNFYSQRNGDLLHVRMYSRRINLTVPEGIEQVSVERPWLKSQDNEPLSWRDGQSPPQMLPDYTGEPIQTRPGAHLEIRPVPPNALDPVKVHLKRTPLWAIGRRQLCEARDRVRPSVDWLRSLNRKNNGS